jgi:hypothetical protein
VRTQTAGREPIRRRFHTLFGRVTAVFTALAVFGSSVLPAFAQAPMMTRTEYEACHTQDETKFRAAIEAVTYAALSAGASKIDYGAIVREEWRQQKFDALIDARVDLAVTAVRQETSWAELLKTLAYREKAKELAVDVAERVYRSDALKDGLEQLALGVGQQIGRSIELSTADAALPAQRCLRAFLGPRYGDAVAQVVAQDAGAAFKVDANANRSAVSTGAVVKEASGGLAGAVILVVRRQLARMAQRLGQRLIGSVLSRLVSVVATGVGLVLIAKDAWDFRHGVLPIIASEMKSTATKVKVQQELASAIETQIGQQVRILASEAADQILDIWRSFRRSHEKVVELAEKDEGFRKFLDAVPGDRLGRLDEIVGLILREGGEAAVLGRLSDGSLGTALVDLPEDGMQIARETGAIGAALDWHALAGDELAFVRRYELHRRGKAEQFTQTALKRLFSLNDGSAIGRLASISPDARQRLFELPNAELSGLASRMTASELGTLASYLVGLPKEASARVLRVVAQAPGRMRVLSTQRVRDAILGSQDQTAAVNMMLREDGGFEFAPLVADFRLAFNGKVSHVLLWEKHPLAVVGIALALFMLVLVMLRLFSGGRRVSRDEGGQAVARADRDGAATPGSGKPAKS